MNMHKDMWSVEELTCSVLERLRSALATATAEQKLQGLEIFHSARTLLATGSPNVFHWVEGDMPEFRQGYLPRWLEAIKKLEEQGAFKVADIDDHRFIATDIDEALVQKLYRQYINQRVIERAGFMLNLKDGTLQYRSYAPVQIDVHSKQTVFLRELLDSGEVSYTTAKELLGSLTDLKIVKRDLLEALAKHLPAQAHREIGKLIQSKRNFGYVLNEPQ